MCNRFAQQPQERHAGKAKDQIGQPERAAYDGEGCFFACRSGQLPYPAVAQPATSQRRGEADDILVKPHQADAGRPQQHRQHFDLDDADDDIDHRGTTYDGARTEDLAVGCHGLKAVSAAMT